MYHVIDDYNPGTHLPQGQAEPMTDQDGEILCSCCIIMLRRSCDSFNEKSHEHFSVTDDQFLLWILCE